MQRRGGALLAFAGLVVLPLFSLVLTVAGPFRADPVLMFAGVQRDAFHAAIHGYATIDPNEGYTSFALGSRAARDVLAGGLPLWNPYEGLGAPLLGEMQSAALFPPTWLLILPHGQAIERALLQWIAGLGACLFFRAAGATRCSALTGGMLWEVNGVFAWLHSVTYNPVAFLPWLLLAVWRMLPAEPASAGPPRGAPGAVALGGIAGALALYSGFPEQVFLYTPVLLLAALFRMATALRDAGGWRAAGRYILRLMLAAACALALAAPLLVAFADFMAQAQLGPHAAHGFAGAYIQPAGLLQVFAPYVLGAVFSNQDPAVTVIYGNTGGYLGLLPAALALVAVLSAGPWPRVALRVALALWIAVSLGASYGFMPAVDLLNGLPFVSLTAYFRYLNAGWLFAAVWLAVDTLDGLRAGGRFAPRVTIALATVFGAALLLGGCYVARGLLAHIVDGGGSYALWAFGALLLAVGWLFALLFAGFALPRRRVMPAVGTLLIAEACVAYYLPFLSYPTRGRVDWALIDFLRGHAGLSRVVNFRDDVMQPNFGSYFGIAQINYDDLPTPLLTTDYVLRVLDPVPTDRPTLFKAGYPPLSQAAREQRDRFFVDHMGEYGRAGVRYVLARPGQAAPLGDAAFPARRVYADDVAEVWVLPTVRDYASAPGCTVHALSRVKIESDCPAPATLTRLEVAMSGWSARVNGRAATVGREDGTFQTVAVPAGHARILFAYWPRFWWPAVAAFAGGFVVLIALGVAWARRAVRYPPAAMS